MICDDLPEERANLVRMLRQYESEHGVELDLETAADGAELLELWKPGRWELVLLDIFMPQLNGIEAGRRLRKVDDKCENVDGMMDWFLRKRAEKRSELLVRTSLGEEAVPVKDIRYIESRGHACDIHLPERTLSVRRSIDELAGMLDTAFYRCHNLKEIIFPDGLLEIGRGAFLSCNHLAAIDLPDSVVLLEDNAFGGNSAASSLHLPAGLTEIKNNFDDLAVSGLEIPETVTVIERSFTSLPNLTEVTVPGSVKVIGSNSFAFCKRLAAVTIPSGTEEIRTSFAGCAKTLVIRVESGSAAEQYCREHQLNYELISE